MSDLEGTEAPNWGEVLHDEETSRTSSASTPRNEERDFPLAVVTSGEAHPTAGLQNEALPTAIPLPNHQPPVTIHATFRGHGTVGSWDLGNRDGRQ